MTKDEPGVTYVVENVRLGISAKVEGDDVKVSVWDHDNDREVANLGYSPESAVALAKRLIINAAKINPELGGVYYFYKEDKEPT